MKDKENEETAGTLMTKSTELSYQVVAELACSKHYSPKVFSFSKFMRGAF